MVKLPTPDSKKLKIELAIEDREIPARLSRHVGPSSLGDPCARAVWYNYRNFTRKVHTPRVLRLFARGHREEPIIIADLKEVGIRVISMQEKAVFADGHGNAYSDGRIIGVPDAPKTEHLLEIKTSNTKTFTRFKKYGIEKTNPKYWVQIQVYMYLFQLKRCLYIIVNKETDERIYLRLKHDPGVSREYLDRAKDIINARTPPPALTGYQCAWCDHKSVCKEGAAPLMTCRSCVSSKPIRKGKWYCTRKGKRIKPKAQNKGCKKYHCI